MKAMILNTYGEAAPFEEAALPRPTPSSGQVVVKIEATSVNTVDTMIRRLGQTELPLSPDLPALLGMDFAGTVEAVGSDVTRFAIGDEVYGCAGGLGDLPGALAEYISADADLIAHKPKTLSMRESAALPLVGITAMEGLQRAQVQEGQTVLVHGGAGGVGHVAVQLAKHYGADVYATVSSDEQFELMRQYGATGINYRSETIGDYVQAHTQGRGFDVIYDSVGGANMSNSFEAAALNGTVVSTVSMLDLDLTPAHFKGLSIHVVFMLIPMLHNVRRHEHQEILSALAKIVDSGSLKPLVDHREFSLLDVDTAYAHLESGQAVGKIVISI